jgi:hypothetical protein
LLFIYIGYRSHSTQPIIELPGEYHRQEINKDKDAWQQKQIEVNSTVRNRIEIKFFHLAKSIS